MFELEKVRTEDQQNNGTRIQPKEGDVKAFKADLRGELLRPGDNDFDSARKVFNGAINKMPAMIVRCAGVADVMNSVKFARANGLLVAIRGSGHNVAGNAVCDGGLVIDLSRMRSIRVDPTHQTARAEAGTIWADFDRETQAFGLATTGGTVSSTGIAGLTLGGGIGWLMGKYGLTCDNLLSADVVTADGQFLTTNATDHSDLFWGLRGGGGNFGIVTSFEYLLHPVDQVLGGSVIYPLERAYEVLSFYSSFTSEAPDELTASAALYTRQDGAQVVSIDVCYAGSLERGEAIVRPLRSLNSPIQDLIRPMMYCELQRMFDNPFRAGQQSYWKSSFMGDLTMDAISTAINWFSKVPSNKTIVFLEHYHGAMRRIPENDTAFSHRGAPFGLLIASNWTQQLESSHNIQWTQDFFKAMQVYSLGKVYMNYLGDEGEDRVKAAYGADKYERLVQLKNKYDPTNFLRLNQNIKPNLN